MDKKRLKKKVQIGNGADISNSVFDGKNSVGARSFVHNCKIGKATYIGREAHLLGVRIGSFSSIADSCVSCIGNHPTSGFVSTHPAFYYNTEAQIGFTFHKGKPLFEGILKFPKGESEYNIVIGNDVWVGSHVLLMGGISIGDGAVVAAGSVVTKDVEPYSIVGGIPARHIRYRFDEEQRSFLNHFKWWNLPMDFIEQNYEDFSDIESFMIKYK